MPTDILLTDIRFPSKASLEGKKTDEKIDTITNYLYMLKEQLAYNMYHIGSDQLLPSVEDDITAPLYKHLEDSDGNIAELMFTASGLTSRVQNAEGDISYLSQTASSLSSRISNAEGDISSVTQLANALVSRVEDNEGDISTLTQTAKSLTTRVSNAEDDASEALQTVNGFTLKVTNSGDTATIGLYNGNMLYGSAQNIYFSGYVTFTDLEKSGNTTINGDNITTGTIEAIEIEGCTITGSIFNTILSFDGDVSGEIKFHLGAVVQNDGALAGGLKFDDQGANTSYESQYRIFLYAQDYSGDYPVALKLQADSRMSIESGTLIWMKTGTMRLVGDDIYLSGNVYVNGTLIS